MTQLLSSASQPDIDAKSMSAAFMRPDLGVLTVMRIAYLTSAFGRTTDTFIRNEVNQLREAGVQIDTFSVRRPPLNESADHDLEYHRANTEYLLEAGHFRLLTATCHLAMTRPKSFLKAAALAWELRPPGFRNAARQLVYFIESCLLADRILKRKIAHIHNHIAENSATVALLSAQIAGIGFSMTVHGPGIFFAPHHWRLAEKVERSTFTACISHFCRSQCMVFTRPSSWQRLRLVRCGLPITFLEPPVPRSMHCRPRRIVSVGRICAEKGHLLLIEACRHVSRIGHEFVLEIIGDGPLRRDCQALIEASNLGDRISLVGAKPSSYVREAIEGADLFVLPSYSEGLPVVLMESLALECPVVSTNVAGIPELIEHGLTGWLVPPGDVDALAGAIVEAIGTPTVTLREMGRRGRLKALQAHHPRAQAQELFRHFSTSILGNGSLRP